MKRRYLGIAVVAAALAAGGWYFSRSEEAAVTAPPTVAVDHGTVEQTVLATGAVEAMKLVSVGAQVSGRIEKLTVDVGDHVEAGDLIAQIDSLDQQNAVARTEAALAQVDAQIAAKQASLDEAEITLTRTQRLADKEFATTEALDSAEANHKLIKAEVAALQAARRMAEVELAATRLDLERTRITAPSSGTVVAVVTNEGQTVVSAQQAPVIVKIAELGRVVIKADVSEADVVKVAPGQAARFTLLGAPDRPFDATLASIEPAPASIEDSDEIDSDKAIYYRARFEVDNPDGLMRIGMTAEVTISIARADDVLRVLSSVLGKPAADGSYEVVVWNPASQTSETRKVTVGISDDLRTEIRSGLTEGELVVSDRTSGETAVAQMRRPPGMPGF